jgi:hypothetical protein
MTGEWEGRGEIKHLNLTRSEVGWEPQVDFDDSRWHMIERAMLKEEIKRIPGFITGTELLPDASTADVPKKTDEMVLVTQFLERPCPDYPVGPVLDRERQDHRRLPRRPGLPGGLGGLV